MRQTSRTETSQFPAAVNAALRPFRWEFAGLDRVQHSENGRESEHRPESLSAGGRVKSEVITHTHLTHRCAPGGNNHTFIILLRALPFRKSSKIIDNKIFILSKHQSNEKTSQHCGKKLQEADCRLQCCHLQTFPAGDQGPSE